MSIVDCMHDWVPREEADNGKWFNSVYIQGSCHVAVKIEFQEAVAQSLAEIQELDTKFKNSSLWIVFQQCIKKLTNLRNNNIIYL